MTREELLNGYKEDVRDFAKECLHFEEELDATFFDNWAEHFTNLAERLRPSLPEGLEEAAEKASKAWHRNEDGSESKELFPQTFVRGFIAGAEYQRKQDQQLIELAEDHAMLAGMNKMKEQMMKKAEECELYWDGDFLAIDLNMAALGYSERDKVKVIVVPEEK